MTSIVSRVSIVLIALLFVASAFGQGDEGTGVRAEILGELEGLEKKYVALAEAMPEAKYGWRPAEKVRSVSEVFMHVAGANYRLPSFMGVKAPGDVPQDMEKITDKASVVKQLKGSFDFVKDVIRSMSDKDVEKTAQMFGKERTYREIGFFMAGHLHEHIGQLIAYARMNGIAPPWSNG